MNSASVANPSFCIFMSNPFPQEILSILELKESFNVVEWRSACQDIYHKSLDSYRRGQLALGLVPGEDRIKDLTDPKGVE